MHTLESHIHSASIVSRHFQFGPSKRWLLSLPIYHVGGLSILFRAIVGGGGVVISPKHMPLHRAIYEFGITHLSLVPTQLARLLDTPHAVNALRHLDALILGGAPLQKSLWDRAVDLGLPLSHSYGMTESASMIAVADRHPNELSALPGTTINIAATGEISLRSQALCMGYVEQNSLRKERDIFGFFHTKDKGEWLDEKTFRVDGRLDNQFICGGENIQPEEIEHALMMLPGVRYAVVVPKADPIWGQRPVAFVLSNNAWNASTLANGLIGTVASFKIPKEFRPLDPLLQGQPKRIRTALKALVQSEQG
jgi:O-succinylbenzoic acid--CoA ligase